MPTGNTIGAEHPPGAGPGARLSLLLLFSAAAAAAYSGPLTELYARSLESELYSHIVLIPFISAYLFYLKKNRPGPSAPYGVMTGFPLLLAAAGIRLAGDAVWEPQSDARLALMVFSAVVFWIGGFVVLFGARAARESLFPLLFLFFAVPVPEAALDPLIRILQTGSAEAAWLLFQALGQPVQRDGLFFHLPGMTVEVARQCSGIRSSLALFISGAVAANMFLRTWPGRLALIAALLPIAALKNGVRITALTLMGYHVDERVLYGSLHTRGGIPFFLLALMMAGLVTRIIRTIEVRSQKRRAARDP